ncbi:ABC transporter substrate-binding protein [Roseococcus sp. YIM B11640]|uniref:ABC transporter substrate-binding protein n=1 Tax=Roseococcus sp. YIM B11640 TaxID=3133973 RepID=UPI003C7B49A1
MPNRRDLFRLGAASAAALHAPSVRAQQARVLKFIPHSNLFTLDPIWNPAAVVRNHGFMVFDTLYGVDETYQARPQMAAGHVFEDGERVCTITLREGLTFHDGSPVRGRDVVASLQRWMRRASVGQKLAEVTDELTTVDDRRIRFQLKRRFPQLLRGLGQASVPIPFIMPERLANTDPFQQVREVVGSGPFRFIQNEFNPGGFAAYERFAGYRPAESGEPSLIAGPKRVHFDRVEWHIIPDAATAAAAIQSGAMDWFEAPPTELEPLLARSRAISVESLETLPRPAMMRINQLNSPLSDVNIRRAILPAVDQKAFMSALVGDEPSRILNFGVYTPGTPYASEAGLEPLLGPRDVNRSKQMLRDAGYANQPVRLLGAMDVAAQSALAQVAADLFRRVDMNLDFAAQDWGSLMQRTNNREGLDRGGWSAYCTFFPGLEFTNPGAHLVLRGNGLRGANGWPTSERLEALREEWFQAPDAAAEMRIATEMQRVAIDEVLFIPLGAYRANTAIKKSLTGRVQGLPVFWNIRQA